MAELPRDGSGERGSGRERVNWLLGVSALGLVSGILLTVRMQRNASVIAQSSGFALAFKALGMGTLMSFSSCGLAAGLLARSMDVGSVQEFLEAVRRVAHSWAAQNNEAERKLQEKLSP